MPGSDAGASVTSSGRRPMTPKTPVGDTTLSLQLEQFFDEYCAKVTSCSLGRKWTRKQAMTVVLQLFQLNGVAMTEEDVEWAASNPDRMMPFIVRKMPYSIRENFETLAQQLSMLIDTACHMRTSLENDDDDDATFEAMMEEPKTAQIKATIFKDSVVHATVEVSDLLRSQNTWVKNMETRLERLSRSAELAEEAQRRLLATETQLKGFHENSADKSQRALMGFAEQTDRNMLQAVYSNWLGITMKNRRERGLRKEFEAQITVKETLLIQWKQNSLKNVREAMKRAGNDNDARLMSGVFEEWADQVGSDKKKAEEQVKLDEVNARMAGFSSTQQANARKVMARTAAGNDEATASMAFMAWARGMEEFKAERKIDEEAAKIEGQLKAFKEKSREKTAGVMDKMGAATNTSLMAQTLTAWQHAAKDMAKARELENTILSAESRFKSLNENHRGNAARMQTRVTDQVKDILMTKVLAAWQLEVQNISVQKKLKQKVESKRKQLSSLQGLFSTFAKELEENLANAGEDDAKTSARPSRAGASKMSSPPSRGGGSRGDTPKSLSKGCSLPALPQAQKSM